MAQYSANKSFSVLRILRFWISCLGKGAESSIFQDFWWSGFTSSSDRNTRTSEIKNLCGCQKWWVVQNYFKSFFWVRRCLKWQMHPETLSAFLKGVTNLNMGENGPHCVCYINKCLKNQCR